MPQLQTQTQSFDLARSGNLDTQATYAGNGFSVTYTKKCVGKVHWTAGQIKVLTFRELNEELSKSGKSLAFVGSGDASYRTLRLTLAGVVAPQKPADPKPAVKAAPAPAPKKPVASAVSAAASKGKVKTKKAA